MSIDFYHALNAATQAAYNASGVLMEYFTQRETLVIDKKAQNDLVSQADREAEQAIVETLRRLTPDFALCAEESGQHTQDKAPATWYIDPLDGTTNFLHGIPHFAVSIGLVAHQGTVLSAGASPLEQDTPIVSVVYDPNRNELFSALYQMGSQLNGQKIRCSRTETISEALLATGVPFRDFSFEDEYNPMLSAAIHHSQGVRRFGSAALDLAWVACGRYDGYWELRLAPWDVAAGTLLVREAGGVVNDLYGQYAWPVTGNLIASNRLMYDEFFQLLSPSLKK